MRSRVILAVHLAPGAALPAERHDLGSLLERARRANPQLTALREAASSMEAAASAEGRLDTLP